MQVKLVAFGIAKDILNARILNFNFEGSDIRSLKKAMVELYPKFADLQKLSFAVEEEYQEDDYQLKEDCEVVIIPPVSGG